MTLLVCYPELLPQELDPLACTVCLSMYRPLQWFNDLDFWPMSVFAPEPSQSLCLIVQSRQNMDTADPVWMVLQNKGKWLHLQQEQLGLLWQELKEAVHNNETTNAELLSQVNFFIYRLRCLGANSPAAEDATVTSNKASEPPVHVTSGGSHIDYQVWLIGWLLSVAFPVSTAFWISSCIFPFTSCQGCLNYILLKGSGKGMGKSRVALAFSDLQHSASFC